MHLNKISWRVPGVVAVLGLCAAAAWAQQRTSDIVYETNSKFQKITVLDTAYGTRQMIFDARLDGTDAVQTEMRKANPTELMMSYAQHMVLSVALVEKPRRILIVGLGGAALEKFLHEKLPQTRIDTAELDPAVLAVARRYFALTEDERQVVTLGDGRKFIEGSKDKFDVIMLDAFNASSIPYPLSTKEFLTACKDHLAEGGVVVANLWPEGPDYPDMVKTYDAVFPEWHVTRAHEYFNVILTAFPNKREVTAEKWMAAAQAFDEKYKLGLNLKKMVDRDFEPQTRIPTYAKVLLDKDEPK